MSDGYLIKLPVISRDLMTIAQAAEELGVHLATAYRWVERGKLHPFHFGDQELFHAEEVRALKEEKDKDSEV